jgi:hypothetical protein
LEVRRDLQKVIPDTDWNEHAIRWGVVLLVFHHFYDDQAGGYSVNRALKDSKGMLQAFEHALADHNALYGDAPKLELQSVFTFAACSNWRSRTQAAPDATRCVSGLLIATT